VLTSKEREGKGREGRERERREENDLMHPLSQISGYATVHPSTPLAS